MQLSDAEIPDSDSVDLWRVRGLRGVLYPTKIAAEAAARYHYPHESVVDRYSRIFYVTYIREET